MSELPDIFTVRHRFDSRREWISVQDMEKSVQVLARLWAEEKASPTD